MISIWSLVEEGVEEVEDMGVVSVEFLFIGFVFLKGFDPIRMICVAGDFL
jgi:hypothetical protein